MGSRVILGVAVVSLLSMGAPATAWDTGEPSRGCDSVALTAIRDSGPVGTGPCPGVRPGGFLSIEDGAGCTLNFLFEGFDAEGESTGQYIGTAGHCTLAEGEQVWPEGEGQQAFTGAGQHIGHVVYSDHGPGGSGRDFALIKLEPGVDANPAMCHWGGPTARLTQRRDELVELKHYGNGLGFGNTVPARTAYSEKLTGQSEDQWVHGAAFRGDSGSGVMTADGHAIGVLVGGGLRG